MRSYYVYILANRFGTLYTGVTNSLERRVYEHKAKFLRGFTARYKVDRLVYYEETGDVEAAIAREKEIKGWRRSKKIALIAEMNPRWEDLASGWYGLSEVGARGQTPRSARGDRALLCSKRNARPLSFRAQRGIWPSTSCARITRT